MVQRKLTSLIAKIEQDLQEVRDEFLTRVAFDLVQTSVPTIDTGAYITSHSITTTRGAGRGRTSHGKPKADPSAKMQESLNQLMSDIASLPKDQTQIYMTNNAPHATSVESGGPSWRANPNGYQVYTSVRNRAGIHLQEAINKVKGGQ